MHGQARDACSSQCGCGSGERGAGVIFLVQHDCAPYFFLVSLDRDLLIGVADALALVGLGRADRAHFGGDLAHVLAVGPLITISVCVGRFTLMPAGMSCDHGCEKPICRFSLSPWRLGAVTHADQRQLLLEALASRR